ncbi:MAG: DUF2460 domain-containing protein [Chitinispirillales bacterium]|jgi:hypothetical protein|nr:DUF2460 domain-containing protein [Chitinispirillales bacterium]
MLILKVLTTFIIIASSIQLLADDTTATAATTFYLHPKMTVESIDTLVARLSTDSTSAFAKPAGMITSDEDHGNVNISGYKSFGVSIGQLGEVNLEQGLEALIEGEIRPGTTLRAQLSDQGSSLDGSTREISDFDMMFIELIDKNFTVTAGDLLMSWPEGGILSGQKKIVGLSAAVRPKGISVNMFGSFSGGNHTVQNIRGQEGVQGPYYLTGKGEAGIITPIDGTVRVRRNGRELEEGINEDFTVDYDIGAITFNPRVLISQDDFIRVEYEYKSFDYRRTFAGGGMSYQVRDSVFTIRGILWSESDDKNHPIEMQLSDREREILRNSGNRPAYATSTARPVHPLDVARMSVFHPLYKKVFDDNAQDTILVYTPYDPLRPEDIRGFYTAHFTPIQTGAVGADYIIDNTVQRGQFVYKYVGAGQGDHTLLAPITAPMRESAGEIGLRLKLPHVRASLDMVGKETDRNLFSNIDGTDLSSAIRFKLNAGERRLDQRTIWADVDYRFRSRGFTNEVFTADERREGWGADDIADGSDGHQFQSWESTVGGTFVRGAALSIGAGQAFIDSLAETEKITADAQLRFAGEKYGLDFGASIFRHHLSNIDISHRRYGKFTARPIKSIEYFVDYRDEWRIDTTGIGGGHLSGTVEAAYIPANLRQNFNFTQYRRGENFPGSIDTGFAFTWNQSVAFSPARMWQLTGDSRWRYVKIYNQSAASTFLLSTVSEIEQTGSGFASRQEYRINQELASRFEQKMFYIGKGLGTHAFDSTAGEFRPAINGDHIVQEIAIYDNTSSATVRKTTLSGDWYFRPTKTISGILNDITWSGILSLEEHVDSRHGSVVSYIPGMLSFWPSDNNNADESSSPLSPHPNFSDLSYRQNIEHRASGSPWKSQLYFLPGLRIIRGYKEPMFQAGLLVERKKNRLTLSASPKYLTVSREDLPNANTQSSHRHNFDLTDIGIEFIQSIDLGNTFEFYIRERAGRIYDNDPNRILSVPIDSSFYLQIRPGIIHRPARGGLTELSYTFSYVPWPGDLDFRMAGGQQRGTSHIIAFLSDINAGKYFNFSGMYRGELTYARMTHVLSLQAKLFL